MAHEWARQTRAAQGLPFHVTDPGVIHRVLTLLGRTQRTAKPDQRREDEPAA